MCVYLCMCVYYMCAGAHRGQEGASDPLELELLDTRWWEVLGVNPWSSGIAVITLKLRSHLLSPRLCSWVPFFLLSLVLSACSKVIFNKTSNSVLH